MDYIFEVILAIIMILMSLLVVFIGFAVWWSVGVFIMKLIISVFTMLSGLSLLCLSIWFMCNLLN